MREGARVRESASMRRGNQKDFCDGPGRFFDRDQSRLLRWSVSRTFHCKSPRRLARPRTSPFHGGNTGSNPVGDANKIKDFPFFAGDTAGTQ